MKDISMRRRSAYIKEIIRSITHSLSRFWAIFAIVALGAGFFAGLRATAPDMRITTDAYFDKSNMMDLHLISTLGFTAEDVTAIQKTQGVQAVMPTYSTDVISKVESNDETIRIHGLPTDDRSDSNQNYMNRPTLVEGRWPQNPGECVIDNNKSFSAKTKIGETITIEDKDQKLSDTLKYSKFKIVGYVQNAYYLSFSLGTTTIGNGKLDRFVYISNSDFASAVYTDLFVTVKDAKNVMCFNSKYSDMVSPVTDKLKTLATTRQVIRYQQVKSEAQAKVDDAAKTYAKSKIEADLKFADAKKKLDDAQVKITTSEQDLIDGQKKVDSGTTELADKKAAFNEQISTAQASIDSGRKQLEMGRAQLTEKEPQLTQAKLIIDTAKAQIAQLVQAGQTEQAAAASAQLKPKEDQYNASFLEFSKQTALLTATEKKLQEIQLQLDESKQTALSQFSVAQQKLDSSTQELASGRMKLAQAKKELADGQKTYLSQKSDADKKLADAAQKIADGQSQVEKISKSEWYVLNRDTNIAYASMKGDATRMDSLATVFPLIFFLVAILVVLTTMTRMVEEERVLIGTYKALGYSKYKIAMKYLVYGALASIFGSLLGILIGFQVLPLVVWNSYAIMYTVPPIILGFNVEYALVACVASVACTLSATFAACYSSLLESPATLMLPRAPKAGKRILLERVQLIWSHLSFTHKVTARNLFRYKKRFFMTVIGIAGCTGLLLTGFGIKDSVSDIVSMQYKEIAKYDTVVQLSDHKITSQETTLFNDKHNFSDYLVNLSKSSDITNGGKTSSAYLIVPESSAKLKAFITLRDRSSHRDVGFDANGVVVTEKFAKMLGIQVGSTITTQNSNKKTVSLKVTGITENYVYNYIYVAPELYRSAFAEDPDFNQIIAKTASDTDKQALSAKLLNTKGIGTVNYVNRISQSFDDMIKSLNYVVLVLIISAGLLAFIVLYNLTNINVTERQREIATIKVLGFFDNEVSSYIYRETALLTIIGCALGLVFGVVIHAFVIQTVETDMVMFGRVIHAVSYVWSAALTILFSLIVNFVMYHKLKKIDMVESLKSVD